MKEVTKMTPGYGLHHHKFKEYLEEGEQCTEVYFNAVIWLGCENLFKRFTEQLPQIKDTWNERVLSGSTCQTPQRLTRLFFYDVARLLNTPKLRLQGERKPRSTADMTKEIRAFWLKLDVWIKQLETTFTVHSRSAPHSTKSLHLKSEESYKSISKEIHTF